MINPLLLPQFSQAAVILGAAARTSLSSCRSAGLLRAKWRAMAFCTTRPSVAKSNASQPAAGHRRRRPRPRPRAPGRRDSRTHPRKGEPVAQLIDLYKSRGADEVSAATLWHIDDLTAATLMTHPSRVAPLSKRAAELPGWRTWERLSNWARALQAIGAHEDALQKVEEAQALAPQSEHAGLQQQREEIVALQASESR